MTGLDLSERLLALAQTAAKESQVDVCWHQADMRDIPWQEEFDAVISIFTSFGYFEDEGENQRVLDGVTRALKPGGRFLLDVPSRDGRARLLGRRNWFEVNGLVVWEESFFDLIKGISGSAFYWQEGGERRQCHFRTRLYTPTELVRMLRAAGLRLIACYGDWEGSEFTVESDRQILIAEKLRGEAE